MRGLLSLVMTDVADVHDEVCAPAYRKSVREVMGTTGIIPDEYWEGLTVLRERLGLSEEAAKALFASETTEKMKGYARARARHTEPSHHPPRPPPRAPFPWLPWLAGSGDACRLVPFSPPLVR